MKTVSVVDSNVVVAGLRSKRGASFEIVSAMLSRRMAFLLSVPLILEYDDVLKRPGMLPHFTRDEIEMNTITVRIPASLQNRLGALAASEGVTIDQFIASAAAEKLAAWETEDYLSARAARSNPNRVEELLAKVPDVEPSEAWDQKLP